MSVGQGIRKLPLDTGTRIRITYETVVSAQDFDHEQVYTDSGLTLHWHDGRYSMTGDDWSSDGPSVSVEIVDGTPGKTARDDVLARLDELAALIEAPDTECRPDLLDAMAGLRAAIETSRPRVMTTQRDIDTQPEGTAFEQDGQLYIAVDSVIGRFYRPFPGGTGTVARLRAPATVVWFPPAETQGDQR